MVGAWWGDHRVETQSRPDGLKDVECPQGPGREHAPLRGLRPTLLRGTAREETAGELAPALSAVGSIRPPTMIDHADLGAWWAGIPPTLGQRQRGDEGAIGALVTGLPQSPGGHDRPTRVGGAG
jgi:hypothetical protein